MTIEIYEIDLRQWNPMDGIPDEEILEGSRALVWAEEYEDALKRLVTAINADEIDNVNCYLYIKEIK